ncbi:folate transporter FolT [Oxobacter pfennigii]|uniref:Folate transporter FolT n=1 Tax=Oxobacter pfennigii TaxID=36849 RepID=A0A0P8WNR2_9CLOT|nr:folate family ECF transporter S component [Oxobacter pfennigii]KPU44195.1 folate transporter FolT [Oxobacter pfennigii]
MKLDARKIVYIGLFVAISIVLKNVLSFYPVPTIRISFGDIPIMLSGMMFGPVLGAIAGALSDVLGIVMFPAPTGATFFPGFTLSKILVGAIPALIYRYSKGNSIVRIAVAVVVTEIVCSLLLDTLWLSMMYSTGMLALLPGRVLTRVIMMIIEVPILYVLLERVVRTSSVRGA